MKIDDLIVAKTNPAAQRDATVKTAKAFYQFWNTGDEASLKPAIQSPDFTDHTLPPGRPQGRKALLSPPKNFRAAIPDLSVEVRKVVVANDSVTVHMDFKGHFTGTFGKIKGQGLAIDFIASEVLKVTNGRLTDIWHIEDNLTAAHADGRGQGRTMTRAAVARVSVAWKTLKTAHGPGPRNQSA